MVYCAVVGCSSNNKKKSEDSEIPKFRFFRFPSSKEICKLWVNNCFQKNKFNTETARICSRHFTEDDYQLKEKLLNLPMDQYKLKKDAIPSINLPVPTKEQTISQKIRDKRMETRTLIKNIRDTEQNYASDLPSSSSTTDVEIVSAELQLEVMTDVQPQITNKDAATQTVSSNELSSLQDQIRELQKQNRTLAEQLQKERDENRAVEKIFTVGQLRKLKTKKQIHWSVEDVASAISLYAGGPRSYRLLKKRGYPIPSVPTLRRWASKINLQPGILNVVFGLMKNTTLTRMERSCILLFDEMKIQSLYEYDKKNDLTMAPSNYVQVIMARGIFANWKQPIFYDYDRKITKTLLFKVISKLEEIDYPVYAINCDLGGSNRGLWAALNISVEKTNFENPVSHKRVHVFADAPHMVKLLRNHFLDSGYILRDKCIDSKPLVHLLQNTQLKDLNIAHKLTSEMLTVKGAQRQKVKLATKLFSHTISRAVSRLGMLGLYQAETNWLECSELLKIVNDWFDVFNSQVPRRDSRSAIKAYGLALKEQNNIMDEMKKTMESMRKVGSTSLLPFQKGIIISIESLKELFVDMKTDFDVSYILTHHLNQDPLEGLFSIMRAIGGLHDHPTALQFKYRLRRYLMGRNDEIISESANISHQNISPNILAEAGSSSVLMESENVIKQEHEVVTGPMFFSLNSNDDETIASDSEEIGDQHLDELDWDGLENLAGFIAFKLRKKENLGYIPDSEDSSFSWTNHLTEGGLQKPKEDFLTKCNELDKIFNHYNGTHLKIQKNYLKNLYELAQNVDLSDDAKNLFFRCKMYFRMRILNNNMKEAGNVRKRKMIKTIK